MRHATEQQLKQHRIKRRRAQRQHHIRKFGKEARNDDVNVDIKHWPPFATISSSLPTLTRASEMFNFAVGRSMMPEECLEAMGIPVWNTEGLPFTCPWRHALFRLSPAQIRSLAGNGINAAVLGHVLVFMLGIAEPVLGAHEPYCV